MSRKSSAGRASEWGGTSGHHRPNLVLYPVRLHVTLLFEDKRGGQFNYKSVSHAVSRKHVSNDKSNRMFLGGIIVFRL